MKFKNKSIVLIGLDSIVILLHLLFGGQFDFFNLDKEFNLPSFYSALKLIVIGSLSIFIFFNIKKAGKNIRKLKNLSWLFLGILLIYLGFDEFLTIHETVANKIAPMFLTNLEWYSNHVFYWVLLLSPLIVGALSMFAYFIIRVFKDYPIARKFFIFGSVLFFMVIVLEVIGGFLAENNIYSVLIVLEESSEIFGATFFLFGLLSVSNNKKT